MPGPVAAEMTDDPTVAVTAAKYVLLTTFKRDGSAVPTPVWAAPDGGAIPDLDPARHRQGQAHPPFGARDGRAVHDAGQAHRRRDRRHGDAPRQ